MSTMKTRLAFLNNVYPTTCILMYARLVFQVDITRGNNFYRLVFLVAIVRGNNFYKTMDMHSIYTGLRYSCVVEGPLMVK